MIFSNLVNRALVTVVLAAAMVSSAGASVTLCVPGACDTPAIPPVEVIGPIDGHHVMVQPWGMIELIPYPSANSWNYSFIISGPGLAAVSLPYYGGWDLSQIYTPEGWAYKTLEALPGQTNHSMLWEFENGSTGYNGVGVMFTSVFAPTLAMARIRDFSGEIYEQPLYIPLTPEAIEAGYASVSLPVPEPSGALLFAFGVAFLLVVPRLKRCNSSVELNMVRSQTS